VSAYACIAFVGAVSAALADTAATEVGQLTRGGTWCLVPPKRATPGTPGGVSGLGLVAGAGGALVLSGLAFSVELVEVRGTACAAISGLLGTVVESVVKGASGGRLGHYVMNVITTGSGAAVTVGLWSLLR
jgi:uncharacterized membrane protein